MPDEILLEVVENKVVALFSALDKSFKGLLDNIFPILVLIVTIMLLIMGCRWFYKIH